MIHEPYLNRSISQMIDESMNLPMLTPEEEKALVARWKNGDTEAFAKFILHYIRIVPVVARTMRRYRLPQDDLHMHGFVGLVRATKTFDPEKGSFRTHAGWWIKAEISEYILSHGSVVRFIKTAGEKKAYYNYNRLVKELGITEITPETISLIASKLERVSEADVKVIADRFGRPDISTDTPIGEDGDSTMLDLLASDQDIEQSFVEHDDHSKKMAIVHQILEEFSPRDRDIFIQRNLTDPQVTLEELGQKYGVSRERIRQIENRVVERVHLKTRQVWAVQAITAADQRTAA